METALEPLNPELDYFLKCQETGNEESIIIEEIVEVPAEYNNLEAYTEEKPIPPLDDTLNSVFLTDESAASEYFSLSLVSSPEQKSLSTTPEETNDEPTIENVDTKVVKSNNNNVTREFSIVLHRLSEETIWKLLQRKSNISKRGRKRYTRVLERSNKVERKRKRSQGRPKENQEEQVSVRKQGTKRKYERRSVKNTSEESEIEKQKKGINGYLEKLEYFDSNNEPPEKKRRGGLGRPKKQRRERLSTPSKNRDEKNRQSTSKSTLPKDDLAALSSPEIEVLKNDEQTPMDEKSRFRKRQSYTPEDLYKPRGSTSTRRNKVLINST